MELYLTCRNQTLIQSPVSKIVRGSRNYIICVFSFLTSDWDGAVKTAIFEDIYGEKYERILEDDKCTIPSECIVESGKVKISVYGVKDNQRITSSIVSYKFDDTLYGSDTPDEPDPTVYEQIISLLNKLGLEKGDSLDFDGEDIILYSGEIEISRVSVVEISETAEIAQMAKRGAEVARDEAVLAKNTAIENANISTNNAEETEADRAEVENNKNITGTYMERAVKASEKSEEALNQFLNTLAVQPKRYYRLSTEEMQDIENPNPGDLCYVVDLQNSRTAIYFYDSDDMDGDDVNPEWQFLGNAEFAQMDRTTLLKVLDLAAVALTGSYTDLLNIPNRYDSPIVLDGTGDTVEWDYSLSDTALVTLTADKALTISNSYNGARASLDVYGAKLVLDDAVYLKSATYPYLEAVEGEHYHYEFQRMADKWQVGMMVISGAEAGEIV